MVGDSSTFWGEGESSILSSLGTFFLSGIFCLIQEVGYWLEEEVVCGGGGEGGGGGGRGQGIVLY